MICRKGFDILEIGGIFFFVLFSMITLNILENHSIHQKLALEIETTERSTFQVFWRKSDESFSPQNSLTLQILPSQREYQVALPKLMSVDFLRIDPLDKPSSLHLKDARLLLPRNVYFDFLSSFAENPINLNEMTLAQNATDGTLHMISSGNDPHFEVEINYPQFWYFSWRHNLAGLAVLAIFLTLIRWPHLTTDSSQNGMLAISLPHGVIPRVSSALNISGTGVFRQEKRKNLILYWLDVKGVDVLLLSDLISELQQNNPEARIRFQYNRSGEV